MAVDVPEWGGVVHIRVMTGMERDAFEGQFTKNRYTNLRAYLAVCCCCDATGEDLFKPEDVAELGKKSGVALERIFNECAKLNKLTAADISELQGKSRASRSSASPGGPRSHLA